MRLPDLILRTLMTAVHKGMMLGWFVRRPHTFGAHALALTPERKIVLVKLRYARGWRAPGGGRKTSEDPVGAVLRELREEIGMFDHGRVRFLCEDHEKINFKRDSSTLHVVGDVRYRPHRWSLEIEQVCEFPLDGLPADTHASVRRWVGLLAAGG